MDVSLVIPALNEAGNIGNDRGPARADVQGSATRY